MIEIKTPGQINRMKAAGRLAAQCQRQIASRLAPGVTTSQINRFAEQWLKARGAIAAQKHYKGYPYAICASRNQIVCHGFPDQQPLRSGDIVTIDLVVSYKGWLADLACTYPIGKVHPRVKSLIYHTKQALRSGIKQVTAGNRIGDVSAAMGRYARTNGYGVVVNMVGHGIGRELHQPPEVPNDGVAGTGELIQEGMVFTLEPILTIGPAGRVRIEADGWTVRTEDDSWGAHFEHTVAVIDHKAVILTEQPKKKHL